MIDDIVEMVLKLTWVRDKENRFSALERILEEINDRVTGILIGEEKGMPGRKEDENKR